MNSETEELIDEIYQNYLDNFIKPECPPELDVQPDFYLPITKELLTKLLLENNHRGEIFRQKWGVEFIKKELTWQERAELLTEKQRGYIDENGHGHGFGYISPFTEKMINIWLDREYIPKEIIKLTYNNKTIEIYENNTSLSPVTGRT